MLFGLLIGIVTEPFCLSCNGACGREICGGLTTITGCTLAHAVTPTLGTLVEEVFKVICAWALPPSFGGTTLISISKSLPGLLVFNSTEKLGLLTSGAESVISSSMLLTIWTGMEPLVDSEERLITAKGGLTSIGFHMVPLSCRVTIGWPLSFEVTLIVFTTAPL